MTAVTPRQLVDHAQLLYELGPGLPYPGFGPPIPGTTPEEWMGSVDDVTFDASRGVLTGRAWHNGGGHDLDSERLRIIGVFLDAADNQIQERTEFQERIGANVRWSFELPAPDEWERVLLVTVGQIEVGELFGMDCTDADNRGQSGTVTDENNRRIRACVYRRSDIEVAGERWNPGTATQDLADRALDDLRSQDDEDDPAADGAAPELNIGENAPGADALDAEPVPAVPVGGLGLLAGWLLLMGCRRRRSEPTRRNRHSAG